MDLKKRIIRNVLSNWARFFITAVVAFFISPFVVHTLGNTGYGIWVLVGSLTGYLGILDLGIRPTIVKYVSKYKALEDDQKVNEVINTCLVVFSLIAFVVVAATLVLSFFSPRLFKVSPSYHQEMRIIIILVGLNLALTFPFGVFNAVINALQRFDLANLIMISVYLARSLFIVVFLKLGGGLLALGLIVLITGLVELLLKARYCFKIFPPLKIGLKYANRDTLKTIMGFSIFTFIIGISVRLSFYSDSIVIGSFLSAGAITFFAIGGNLAAYLKELISNLSVVLTPMASTFEARQDYERLRKLLFTGTRYCLMIILPIGYTYLVMGETFINLWMGEEYGPASSRVLTILMWSYFGLLSQFVAGSIFMGLGKIKKLALINLGTAVANIIISVILVKPLGIYGVALGTAIPQTIYGTFILPVYICRVLKLKLSTYVKESFLPPILASLPFLFSIMYFENYFIIDSLLRFGQFVALACAVYAISGFLIGLEPTHKKIMWDEAKITVDKLKGRL